MKRNREKHANIPADLMDRYLKRELTSEALGELTGYNPVYLRRSIKRPPREQNRDWHDERKALRTARDNFRKTLAGLPVEEIMRIAKVSNSTANRIKKRNPK